jgi:exosortase A-associated hydrolase 2
VEAHFLPSPQGLLFCVHYPAARFVPDAVGTVFVPAFAEEMNKSRHVVAQASRRLAAMGSGVLVLDLYGCGDSEGRFEDATWERWQDDVSRAVDWMHGRGYRRLRLWGMRVGALLAAEVARLRAGAIERCIFWQPTVSADTFLTQFLRLRMASAMLTGAKDMETTKALRARLRAGETLEIAGYGLSPTMAEALAKRGLEALPPSCPVEWFEVVAERDAETNPATARVVSNWRSLGGEVNLTLVPGDAFWSAASAVELMQCPSLVDATAGAAQAWQ